MRSASAQRTRSFRLEFRCKPTPQIVVGLVIVLVLVKTVGRRLPHVENCPREWFTVLDVEYFSGNTHTGPERIVGAVAEVVEIRGGVISG